MTITELISELQDALEIHGDIEVMTSSDYGDICHTEQLDHIRSICSCRPKESAYSQSGLAYPSAEDDDSDGDELDIDQQTEQIEQIERELGRSKPEVLVLRHTS